LPNDLWKAIADQTAASPYATEAERLVV